MSAVPRSVEPEADRLRVNARRGARYEARHLQWDRGRELSGVDPVPAVRKCGRVVRSGDGAAVRVSEVEGQRVAGWSGLATCGSVWACPVCSAKIAAHRQGEIERALSAWHGMGGRVAMVTLTMRHRKGQSLRSLWDGVTGAWQAATSGRAWKADQDVYGVPMRRTIKTGKRAGQTVSEPRLRTIRVVEVTNGDAGWHVHIHALVLLRWDASEADAATIAEGMFARWTSHLVSRGFAAPLRGPGMDVRLLTGDPSAALGEYFVKAQYAFSHEVARGDLKDGRFGNRTPWAVLRGLVEVRRTGDLGEWGTPEDEDIWAEWERSSKGRRQVGWSVGLRAELLPDEEDLTDEEVAEADEGGETVEAVDSDTFREVAAARADYVVLEAFARSDDEGRASLAPYRLRAEQRAAERAAGRARYRSR